MSRQQLELSSSQLCTGREAAVLVYSQLLSLSAACVCEHTAEHTADLLICSPGITSRTFARPLSCQTKSRPTTASLGQDCPTAHMAECRFLLPILINNWLAQAIQGEGDALSANEFVCRLHNSQKVACAQEKWISKFSAQEKDRLSNSDRRPPFESEIKVFSKLGWEMGWQHLKNDRQSVLKMCEKCRNKDFEAGGHFSPPLKFSRQHSVSLALRSFCQSKSANFLSEKSQKSVLIGEQEKHCFVVKTVFTQLWEKIEAAQMSRYLYKRGRPLLMVESRTL